MWIYCRLLKHVSSLACHNYSCLPYVGDNYWPEKQILHHVHKTPPLHPVVNHCSPICIFIPSFFKVHLNTILLCVPRFPKRLFTWGFSRQKMCNISSVPVHAVCPAILCAVTIGGTNCEMKHWMGLKICCCLLISGAAHLGLIEFCTKWTLMCMRT